MNYNSLLEMDLIEDVSTLNRKERDRRLRKTDILRAAERIFAFKGYHRATMQDIAKAAQYATGTVYLYFKDKDALYFSLFEEKITSLLALLREKTSLVHDAKDKLDIFIRVSTAFFDKNQDFFRIFISERTKVQVVKDSKFSRSSVLSRHREFVVDLIRACQQDNLIRGDLAPRQLADIFTTIFMAFIFDWVKEGKQEEKDLSALPELILDTFLNGAKHKR